MANAIDFLKETPQRQSALGFLGVGSPSSGASGGGGLPEDVAALVGNEGGFYQPPVDGKTAASLRPSKVVGLNIMDLIAIKYAANDEQRVRAAAKALGRPDSDFMVKDGDVYLRDAGETVRVGGLGGTTPGEALANLGKEAVATAASNPASTVGNAALAFTAPEAIPSPWVQGALGGLDEAVRRIVGKTVLPGSLGTERLPWGMSDAVAIPVAGGLSAFLTSGVNKLANAGRAPILGGLTKEEVAAGVENLAKSPVPLTLGQATRNPGLLDAEGRLRMLPGALDVARRQGEAQNVAAREAVENFAGAMASGTDPAMLGRNLTNAAAGTLQELKNARARQAGPLYEMAFARPETPPRPAVLSQSGNVWTGSAWADPATLPMGANASHLVQTATAAVDGGALDALPLVGSIDARIGSQNTPEAIRTLLEKAKAQLMFDGKPKNTAEALQGAKQGIDALIQGLGENEAQAKAALMGVKSDLVGFLDANVPGYAQANRTFAEASGSIRDFWDSTLNKVRKLPPDAAWKGPGMLFNPAAPVPAAPSMVEGWKDSLAGLFPQSWDDALAARILQASQGFKASANGGLGNYPGQVAKELGGSPAAMDMWRAGMSPEQFARFKTILDGLGLASQGSKGQSWTFAGQPAMEALQDASMGPVEGVISSALGFGRATSPGRWADLFQEWRFGRNAPKLAEFLFNPPQGWEAMAPPPAVRARIMQSLGLIPREAFTQETGGAFQ